MVKGWNKIRKEIPALKIIVDVHNESPDQAQPVEVEMNEIITAAPRKVLLKIFEAYLVGVLEGYLVFGATASAAVAVVVVVVRLRVRVAAKWTPGTDRRGRRTRSNSGGAGVGRREPSFSWWRPTFVVAVLIRRSRPPFSGRISWVAGVVPREQGGSLLQQGRARRQSALQGRTVIFLFVATVAREVHLAASLVADRHPNGALLQIANGRRLGGAAAVSKNRSTGRWSSGWSQRRRRRQFLLFRNNKFGIRVRDDRVFACKWRNRASVARQACCKINVREEFGDSKKLNVESSGAEAAMLEN